MNTNYFKKEFKIFNVLIRFEEFRLQNKFLNLPHKLFKSGIHTYVNKDNGIKAISFVYKNYRLIILK